MYALSALLHKLNGLQWSLVVPRRLPMRERYKSLRRASKRERSQRLRRAASLHIQRIDTLAELTRFAPQWRALYEESDCRLPFLEFAWCYEWWRAFARPRPLVSHSLAVLTAHHDGRLVGILPYYRTTYGFGRALGLTYVRPLGSDGNLTELRTGLVLPGYEQPVVEAAEKFFAQHAAEWDLVNWGSFHSPVAAGLGVPGHWFSDDRHEPIEVFNVELPTTWEAFTATLKRNTKEAIRHAHNGLKRDGRAVRFFVFDNDADIAAHLPRYFDLHRQRSRWRDSAIHPDTFDSATDRQFMTNVSSVLAGEGKVRLFALEVDGSIVALRLCFVSADTLYWYYSGFDPAFGKYSVMTRLIVEIIRWAIDNRICVMNLSTGRDQSKLRWNPTITKYQTYSQIGPRFRAKLAFAIFAKP